MKKHSKFFTRNQATIQSLLQQLTLRDIQSQEVKINELINRQKQNKESMRSLKTSQRDDDTPKLGKRRLVRRGTVEKPASTRELDKQNKLVPLLKKVSVNVKSSHNYREFKSNKEGKDIPLRKIGKLQCLNSYQPILPEITRPSKRNSIQINENFADLSRFQLNSQSANTTKLAIIQQTQELSKLSQSQIHKKQWPFNKQRSFAFPKTKFD